MMNKTINKNTRLTQLQTIKILNQRLADMKKTLQNELKSSGGENVSIPSSASNESTKAISDVGLNNGHNESDANQLDNKRNVNATAVVMDDVNLKYLKHVILKFLTSREVKFLTRGGRTFTDR